jgi:hypothetical protein
MNPHEEACRAAEIKLRELQKALLDPRPEVFEQCEAELGKVAGMLQPLISSDASTWGPGVADRLREIKHATNRLRLQIDHGLNLCRGWIQLRMGTGYTQAGLPVFAGSEARSLFEG